VSVHPLIELANDHEVKQAKGFIQAAAGLTGEALEALYQQEVASAPRRDQVAKKYLGERTGRIPRARQHGRDEKHLALALGAWAQSTQQALELPSGDALGLVDCLVPLRTAAPDKSSAEADANKGVEDIDLLGLLPGERLAIVQLKYLEPEAARGGAGDTPLRMLLGGLATTAHADANRKALRVEIEERTGRTIGDEAPALILVASRRYWEICRKREAQKGAAWIRELERLAREIGESIGVEVSFAALELDGNPGWEYGEDGPRLQGAPRLRRAWEAGAGKLKPKPKVRKTDPAVVIVEADPTKAPRRYQASDSYRPGDRIDHPTLGQGVVQTAVGRGKISVLFGADSKLLVHERASLGA
jgi:hypothetical protein